MSTETSTTGKTAHELYGPLLFHAENPVGRVRRRTVRWLILAVLAAALITAAFSSAFLLSEPTGPPPWWAYVMLRPGWILALWSVFELLNLLTVWRRVGWAVDVYERGVVESRFGEVRQLRAGREVSFPGRREGTAGITLTPRLLRLPDGREYEHASSRVQYVKVTGGGDAVTRTLTDDPSRANTIVFLTDDDANGYRTEGGFGIPGLLRASPNLAVVRETLHILIDPDGHRAMRRAQLARQEQEQP